MLESDGSARESNILGLLYPDFERFISIDLKTSSPQRADIVELATARFHLPDALVDVQGFQFRSECDGPAGGNRQLPVFSECRDEIAARCGLCSVFVLHDRQPLPALRSRLPGWTPGLVMSAERLSRALFPRRDRHDLDHLITDFGLDARYDLSDRFGPNRCCGYRCAGLACLFPELLHAAKHRGWRTSELRFAGSINAP